MRHFGVLIGGHCQRQQTGREVGKSHERSHKPMEQTTALSGRMFEITNKVD